MFPFRFSEEIFYQILLFDFGNFGKIVFDPPLSLRELLTLALESDQSGWTAEDDGPIENLVENAVEKLTDKSDVLKEYYNLIIDDEMLMSLPLLIGK